MGTIISDCGIYRYRLERRVDLTDGQASSRGTMMFLMVNPSTADAENDDPTIRKCIGFAARYGCDRLLVGNKFAFRATDVNRLRDIKDPVGPDNDAHLLLMLREADIVVAGWGQLAKLPEVLRDRWKDVVRLADEAGRPLHALGVNGDKHPKHPLMPSYESKITEWPVPWFPNRVRAA